MRWDFKLSRQIYFSWRTKSTFSLQWYQKPKTLDNSGRKKKINSYSSNHLSTIYIYIFSKLDLSIMCIFQILYRSLTIKKLELMEKTCPWWILNEPIVRDLWGKETILVSTKHALAYSKCLESLMFPSYNAY